MLMYQRIRYLLDALVELEQKKEGVMITFPKSHKDRNFYARIWKLQEASKYLGYTITVGTTFVVIDREDTTTYRTIKL